MANVQLCDWPRFDVRGSQRLSWRKLSDRAQNGHNIFGHFESFTTRMLLKIVQGSFVVIVQREQNLKIAPPHTEADILYICLPVLQGKDHPKQYRTVKVKSKRNMRDNYCFPNQGRCQSVTDRRIWEHPRKFSCQTCNYQAKENENLSATFSPLFFASKTTARKFEIGSDFCNETQQPHSMWHVSHLQTAASI